MAKVIVTLPEGWGNRLVMDSKDYAILVELFDRSTSADHKYLESVGDYVAVERKPYPLVAATNVTLMTQQEFEAAHAPKVEEV